MGEKQRAGYSEERAKWHRIIAMHKQELRLEKFSKIQWHTVC